MNQQEEIIERLKGLELEGDSHQMLSDICKAVAPGAQFGWTRGACDGLRLRLISFLGETDEDALREAYMKGRNDGFDRGFASADDWCAQHEDAMAEHGWYRALGADKAPIRIGDKVDSDHHEDGTVMGVQFYEMPRGIRTLVAVRPDGWDVATWKTPDEYHHAPTVEDTLHELIGKALTVMEINGENELVAEYAKRLTLRGDGE